MEVVFSVLYHEKVISDDLVKIGQKNKQRIKKAIEEKLTSNPETFGKPLRRSLKGYRKLRVGDYRIVFKVEKRKIYVLTIQHRTFVYKEAIKRL